MWFVKITYEVTLHFDYFCMAHYSHVRALKNSLLFPLLFYEIYQSRTFTRTSLLAFLLRKFLEETGFSIEICYCISWILYPPSKALNLRKVCLHSSSTHRNHRPRRTLNGKIHGNDDERWWSLQRLSYHNRRICSSSCCKNWSLMVAIINPVRRVIFCPLYK